MSLQEYQTKVKTVKAIMWDGSDSAYDAVAPIIGRSIKSYIKLNGSDTGTLSVYANAIDVVSVKPGDYIVIHDEKLGLFSIISADEFANKYEPATGDSGLVTGPDEGIMGSSTASSYTEGVK